MGIQSEHTDELTTCITAVEMKFNELFCFGLTLIGYALDSV